MTQTLIIEGELPSLNEFIKATNGSRFSGNTMKQDADALVAYYAKKQKLQPIEEPVFIEYNWYCKNKKKDKSNVSFAIKFIEDGLQNAGILKQDNWNAITGFTHNFYIDKKNPRILIFLYY